MKQGFLLALLRRFFFQKFGFMNPKVITMVISNRGWKGSLFSGIMATQKILIFLDQEMMIFACILMDMLIFVMENMNFNGMYACIFLQRRSNGWGSNTQYYQLHFIPFISEFLSFARHKMKSYLSFFRENRVFKVSRMPIERKRETEREREREEKVSLFSWFWKGIWLGWWIDWLLVGIWLVCPQPTFIKRNHWPLFFFLESSFSEFPPLFLYQKHFN